MIHICDGCVWAIEHEEEITLCLCPLYDRRHDCFYVDECDFKVDKRHAIQLLYGDVNDSMS